jgi:hypothetical protein
VKLDPVYAATTRPMDDLPELATIAARWTTYLGDQDTDGFDADRIRTTGQDYLNAAIDSAQETGND